MACPVLDDFMLRQTGQLATKIYKRTLAADPMQAFFDFVEFPLGQGLNPGYVTFEGTAPGLNGGGWTTVAASDGAGVDACAPPEVTVPHAWKTQTLALEHIAINSQFICLTDLMTTFESEKQVIAVADNVAEYVKRAWTHKLRSWLLAASRNKIITLTTGFSESTGAAFPNTAATATLKLAHLDYIYDKLRSSGAEGHAMMDGAPIYRVFISGLTKGSIIKNNTETRNDLRYADPKFNLQPYGGIKVLNGLEYAVDSFGLRFNFTAGAYVAVEPFVTTTLSDGTTASRLNPAYVTAAYEVTFVTPKNVLEVAVPDPGTFNGKFDPRSYRGTVSWQNLPDYQCNPDGDKGRFRAVIKASPKELYTDLGVAIMHLRCTGTTGSACA